MAIRSMRQEVREEMKYRKTNGQNGDSSGSGASGTPSASSSEHDNTLSEELSNKANEYNDDSEDNKSSSMGGVCAIETALQSELFQNCHMDNYLSRMGHALDKIVENEAWNIYMDADGDGTMEDVNLADAVAASYDSVLDLYIEDEVHKIMEKYNTCSDPTRGGYLSDAAIAELAELGIVVDSVGSEDKNSNRVYSFSLVELERDENGNVLRNEDGTPKMVLDEDGNPKVLEDENGNKGSILFADCLIPDGFAQGAEQNMSSLLDMMGKDCLSKADFIEDPNAYYDLLEEVEAGVAAGAFDANSAVNDIYGNLKDVQQAATDLWAGHGSAPGAYHGSGEHDGSYVGEDYENGVVPDDVLAANGDELVEGTEVTVKDVQAEYEARIAEAIADYKSENGGKEATGRVLKDIYSSARSYIEFQYGVAAVEALGV